MDNQVTQDWVFGRGLKWIKRQSEAQINAFEWISFFDVSIKFSAFHVVYLPGQRTEQRLIAARSWCCIFPGLFPLVWIICY